MSNVNMYGEWYKTEIGSTIIKKKYLHEGEKVEDFFTRVSGILSEPVREKMKTAMKEADFFTGGRSLYGAGSKGKFKASMSNCYILPMPEDNIESIFDTCKEMGRIFSYGG